MNITNDPSNPSQVDSQKAAAGEAEKPQPVSPLGDVNTVTQSAAAVLDPHTQHHVYVQTIFDRRDAKQGREAVGRIEGYQLDYERDPRMTSGMVNGLVRELSAKQKPPEDVGAFEDQVNHLSPGQFEYLAQLLIAKVLGISEAMMRRNNDADLSGTLSEADMTMELNHHKEVIAVTSSLTAGTSNAERLFALFAAAVHDTAKYAPIAEGGTLRAHRGKPDNLYSVIHHEALSALATMRMADAGVFSDEIDLGNDASGTPARIQIPAAWIKRAAAAAAGHGNGEFPEMLANRGFVRPDVGVLRDYLSLHLADDPTALCINGADMATGLFGDDGESRGSSYNKYTLINPKTNLADYFSLKNRQSPIGSTMFYQMQLHDILPRMPEVMRVRLQAQIKDHAGAAITFRNWALQLPANDVDREVWDKTDAPPDQRQAAYARLMDRANGKSGDSSASIFTPQALEEAYKVFRKELQGYLKNLTAQIEQELGGLDHLVPLEDIADIVDAQEQIIIDNRGAPDGTPGTNARNQALEMRKRCYLSNKYRQAQAILESGSAD